MRCRSAPPVQVKGEQCRPVLVGRFAALALGNPTGGCPQEPPLRITRSARTDQGAFANSLPSLVRTTPFRTLLMKKRRVCRS